jgi:hypothetical protein
VKHHLHVCARSANAAKLRKRTCTAFRVSVLALPTVSSSTVSSTLSNVSNVQPQTTLCNNIPYGCYSVYFSLFCIRAQIGSIKWWRAAEQWSSSRCGVTTALLQHRCKHYTIRTHYGILYIQIRDVYTCPLSCSAGLSAPCTLSNISCWPVTREYSEHNARPCKLARTPLAHNYAVHCYTTTNGDCQHCYLVAQCCYMSPLSTATYTVDALLTSYAINRTAACIPLHCRGVCHPSM